MSFACQLTRFSNAHIHRSRLKIDQNGTRNILVVGSLEEDELGGQQSMARSQSRCRAHLVVVNADLLELDVGRALVPVMNSCEQQHDRKECADGTTHCPELSMPVG